MTPSIESKKKKRESLKVSIEPGAIDWLSDLNTCTHDHLPRIVGLSEKTLRALDKGGRHKVETVHQLELSLEGYFSDSGLQIWTTTHDNVVSPGQLYTDFGELGSVTEHKVLSGTRCFAIALPAQGLVKLIEDRAQRTLSLFESERRDTEPDPKETQRLLAFENYLWNKYNAGEAARGRRRKERASSYSTPTSPFYGLRDEFRFTIQDSLLPLTSAQGKCVSLLDTAIKELIKAARETKDTYSDSFLDQIENKGIDPYRKSLMEQIAKLKRLNINVLAYSRLKKIRMMNGTYEIDDRADYGLESNEYLFTMYSGLTHIVLAPSNILRVPLYVDEHEIEYQPEPMWICKLKIVGDEYSNTDAVEGLGSDSNWEPPKTEKSNVLQIVSKKNDDETN